MVLQSFLDFMDQAGTLTFDVKDAGAWTFVFGSEEPVREGLAETADLSLTFTQSAFLAFIDGSLDVVDAVKRKEVTAQGDSFELLESFGRLLNPPSNDLGWDVSG